MTGSERSPTVGAAAASDRPRFDGAVIPTSAHAGDDGAADPVLAAVISSVARRESDASALQHALIGRRLMLPTTAVLEDSARHAVTGLAHEKSSHMAAAMFRSDAGWSGLLVFTGLAALHQWSADARPIPVTADEAAAAALEDGCDALVLDFAGPHRVSISGSLLRALAQSRRWLPAYADPVIVELIESYAEKLPGLAAVEVRAGHQVPELADDPADAVVMITPATGADAAEVAADLARVLAREPVLRDRLDGGLAFAASTEPLDR